MLITSNFSVKVQHQRIPVASVAAPLVLLAAVQRPAPSCVSPLASSSCVLPLPALLLQSHSLLLTPSHGHAQLPVSGNVYIGMRQLRVAGFQSLLCYLCGGRACTEACYDIKVNATAVKIVRIYQCSLFHESFPLVHLLLQRLPLALSHVSARSSLRADSMCTGHKTAEASLLERCVCENQCRSCH